jgi:5-methyltetrahydropteroyltriglutamate--homocysteine methyltransferase
MVRSSDRFLTTHTGSLPRPDHLVRIMYAKEEGQAVDRAELAAYSRRRGRSSGPTERSWH